MASSPHSKTSWLARRTYMVASGFVLVGALFTAMNANLPVLRNSLVYARTVENLELHHLALWQVCADPAQVHAQACGFSVFAVPFVRLAGLNVGLTLASWMTTALLIAAMIAFFRRFNGAFGLTEKDLPLELVVTCFNPLVMTQFWSAHPDSVFAAFFLLSFVFLDRLLKDEVLKETWTAVAYTLAVMLAVFVRPAGLILYPLQALYVFWHRREVFALVRRRPRRFSALAASATVLAVWVGLGKLGHNPLVNLNQGEFNVPVPYLSTLGGMVALLAITFGVLLVVAAPRLSVTWESAPLLLMLAAYVHVFMVYHGSSHNMRYYVPVLPLMALFVVRALRAVRAKSMVAAGLAIFAVTNAAAILVYDSAGANRLFARVASEKINGGQLGYFDNLRLSSQLRMKAALDRINALLPPGASLNYVTSYYEGAADGIYQASGLLRPDIRIRYAKNVGDLGPVTGDAWTFFPERIGMHPSAGSSEWLVHGSVAFSQLRK
ncbi:MAG TPA: hypothetical protein VFE90_25165 [Myxococcales bacterium]|jgi:hypothetical protein|nr:hypothetical protein [Myxococcales bacterium]